MPSGDDDGNSDSSAGAASDHEDADEPQDDEPEFDPDDLRLLREEEAVEEHRRMDFYVRVLGGKWTMEHKNVTADACSYFARSGMPTDWCTLFKFPKQQGFAYRKYGGRTGPHVMCNELARRAQYFYNMFRDIDRPFTEYSEAMLASYEDGEEFVEWMLSLDIALPDFAAAQRVRRLVPINPDV